MTDLKMQLIQSLRGKDVELSEDLYRRMSPCYEVSQLNNFFHALLAQYPSNTMDLRASLSLSNDYNAWYATFVSKIFPYLSKKRLPPCTDSNAATIYGTQSK
jgi:hypothetical protein